MITELNRWSALLEQIDPKNSNHLWICKDAAGAYQARPATDPTSQRVTLDEIFKYSKKLVKQLTLTPNPENIQDLEQAVIITKKIRALSERSVEKHTKATGIRATITWLFWRLFYDKSNKANNIFDKVMEIHAKQLGQAFLTLEYLNIAKAKQRETSSAYSGDEVSASLKRGLEEDLGVDHLKTEDTKKERQRLKNLKSKLFHLFTYADYKKWLDSF